MYYDKEGRRTDVNGKPGKIKAMGLDLKRSDTPRVIQDFLSEILEDVLTGSQRQEVVNKILKFKQKLVAKKTVIMTAKISGRALT